MDATNDFERIAREVDSLRPCGRVPVSMEVEIWNQFAAPLRAFVVKRAPREVEPEDVLQDIFVRIQEQLPNLREVDRMDAWIFQIARNVVANAFRRRTRRDALAERLESEMASAPDGDERTAEASLASCLAFMIAALPAPYREAVELTEIRGLTQMEAAQRVGISISGMKSRVQRGREHLKRTIGELCRVETDMRGGVIECDPRRPGCDESVRPSPCSRDSMDMTKTHEVKNTETQDISKASTGGCCGGPATADASACCVLDEEIKQAGGAGCGCAPKPTSTKKGCC